MARPTYAPARARHQTAPEGTVTERATVLRMLARHENEDPAVVEVCLTLLLPTLAHPSLEGEDAMTAWEDYQAALTLLDDVDAGVAHWSWVHPGLTGPDPQQDAVDIAAERADTALAVLLYGRRTAA